MAGLDLAEGPGGVFGDEGIVVLGELLDGGEVVGGSGVAEGDADVAEEASPFGAVDRGVAEALFEGGFVELGPCL